MQHIINAILASSVTPVFLKNKIVDENYDVIAPIDIDIVELENILRAKALEKGKQSVEQKALEIFYEQNPQKVLLVMILEKNDLPSHSIYMNLDKNKIMYIVSGSDNDIKFWS